MDGVGHKSADRHTTFRQAEIDRQPGDTRNWNIQKYLKDGMVIDAGQVEAEVDTLQTCVCEFVC